ncbi:MAG: glycosyltransferase family 2 protein [Pseudomonadales bacterium]
MADRYCILIPHYCHDAQLASFLPELVQVQLPLLVVDDGSDAATLPRLRGLVAEYPWAQLIERQPNQGKGATMIAGMRHAQGQGFTHVIIVDADGQHAARDLVRLHKASLSAPLALFSGNPQFGQDIPKARLYGRMITNVLARLAAGTDVIKDAMCGLRLYPLAQVLPLCERVGARLHMELDTELLVRACWAGLELRYVDTQVVYPAGGRSHFRMISDNLRLTLMHITLLALAARKRIDGGAP